MATTYILDPSGRVRKIEKTDSELKSAAFRNNQIVNFSKEFSTSETVIDGPRRHTSIALGDDFESDNFRESLLFNDAPNSESFGFINDGFEDEGEDKLNRKSFKSIYHFSNDEYFATEFEMLTGFTLNANSNEIFDEVAFLFTYIIEIIAMIGVAEGITSLNQVLSNVSTNDTSTVERFSLRLGQYSISEYDIFTKYMFSVINYPKDHSDTTTRITSYFIGLAEWLNTDSLIDIHKIIEESAQKTSGSKTIENIIDLSGNNLRNQNFGLSSIAYIGISLVETLVNSVQTDSTRKRLMLLLKKFRQEKAWSDQLYTAKKDENNFFVKMDYYYFRFAVERMHIGLKLLNRYGYKKTYLDPSAAESPLTRVSANRTKNKDRNALVSHVIADDGKPITFTRDDEILNFEGWTPFTLDFSDLDGDGIDEIITADYGGGNIPNEDDHEIRIYKFDNSTNKFELHFQTNEPNAYDWGLGATSIKVNDFTNDGILDIAVAREDLEYHGFEVWKGTGNAQFELIFSSPTWTQNEIQFREFSVFDANQDGNLDILLRPFHYGILYRNSENCWWNVYDCNGIKLNHLIWLNDGSGNFNYYDEEELLIEDLLVDSIHPYLFDGNLYFMGTFYNDVGDDRIQMIDIKVNF